MSRHVCTGPNVNNIRNRSLRFSILSFMAMPSPKTNIFLYFIIYPAERTCKKGLSGVICNKGLADGMERTRREMNIRFEFRRGHVQKKKKCSKDSERAEIRQILNFGFLLTPVNMVLCH